MAIVVAILLGALALAFVLYPLYQYAHLKTRQIERAASPPPVDMTAQQVDREESARTALQEVEFDFQLGNLDEDDYRSLREHYMRRALSALKSRHDRQQALDDAIEEQVRKLRENDEES